MFVEFTTKRYNKIHVRLENGRLVNFNFQDNNNNNLHEYKVSTYVTRFKKGPLVGENSIYRS